MLTKNTEQLKQRVAEHVAADSIVQGIYWDTKNMRGCFIGCLAHDYDPSINAAAYGLPLAVQRIAENIFEALTPDEAKAFFAAFPAAVVCDNKDLSAVGWQFLAAELRSLPKQCSAIQAVIDPVIAGMDLLANGQQWPVVWAARAAARAADDVAAWSAAAAAAAANAVEAADDAARAAARAAVNAVEAADDAAQAAARAADAAANAAWAAVAVDARDADVAAWAAACSAAWSPAARVAARAAAAVRLRQRDLLLRLISEAPVVEQLDD